MNREQAEKLLAALIFDDLDETSKAELTAYLQTDDELRYRLADLRMAVKLADDAVNEGPDPVLDEQRLKQLKRLAKADKAKVRVFRHPRFMAAAAVITFALVLIGVLMPSLSPRPPASQPASPKLVFRTDSAPRSYSTPTQPTKDEIRNMAADRLAARAGGTGGMGGMGVEGMTSDRKDNYDTGAMLGYGAGVRGKEAFEALDRSRASRADNAISLGQTVASDAPSALRPDVRSATPPSASGGFMLSRRRPLDGEPESKEAQRPPTEVATGRSSGVRAGKEALDQQIRADEERVLRKLEEQRAAARPATAADPVARNLPGGPASPMQERQMAKEAAGKPIAADPEARVRLGGQLSSTDLAVISGTLRQQPAAEAPAPAEGGAYYDREVAYGWKGKVTPQPSATPAPAPAPSAQMLDNTSVTVAEPDPAASLARTPGESDIAYRTRVAQVRNQQAALRAQQQIARAQLGQETKPGAYLDADSLATVNKKLDQLSEVAASARSDQRVPLMGDVPLVGDLFQKGVQPKANAETPGQATGEITYPTPGVKMMDKQGNLDLRVADSLTKLKDSLTELKVEQNAPSPGVMVFRDGPVNRDADVLSASSHFKVVPVNPWVLTEQDALSTFGLDVDTASYALCQRYIRGGYLPPIGAVRMEEFINAFDYAYPQRDDQPFTVYAEGAPAPFAPVGQDLTLLKVAVKARNVGRDQRRAAHLVFVVDASASMGQADRLPLVQSVANQLVDKLSESDRVSLITCANDARLHLDTVSARQKETIRETINAIQPAGPTNLLAGLKLGYEMARRSFVAGQTNQVVLCSDGVANLGQTEAEAMLQEVAEDRKQAITLTCVGVGYGAYNDAFLEALANQGDGRYVFLDSSEPAQQALVGQLAASLQNVAQDARIQVQFNPHRVRRYRLIGYENRDIEDQRFRDDTVDAGAVGSGQCSTALYELELTASRGEGVPPSNRGQDARDTDDADLGTVFVRYRNVENGQMEETSRPLADSMVRRRSVEEAPRFFLAAGAARFAEWLRQSEHAQNTALPDVQRLLDQVSAALPLDRDVQDLAALAHQAEGLPRAPSVVAP